jgi:predicted nucleic acid-binding protein
LDTSVAVKWHIREEGHDFALDLLAAVEDGVVELLAPSTIEPEFFNALWQQHRRSGIPLDRVRSIWEDFAEAPVSLFGVDLLISSAVGISLDSGVIIYDALFLALAEDADAIFITADSKLLRSIEGTDYAHLACPLSEVGVLIG